MDETLLFLWGLNLKKPLHKNEVPSQKVTRVLDFEVGETDQSKWKDQLEREGKLVFERDKGLFKLRTTITILNPRKTPFNPKKLKKFEIEAKIEKVPRFEKEVKDSVEPVRGTWGTGETDFDPRVERLDERRRTIEKEGVLEWAGGYLIKTDFPYAPATVDPANLRLFHVSADCKVYELRKAQCEYVFDENFLLDGSLDKKEILRTIRDQRILREIARIIGTKDPALALALLPPLFTPPTTQRTT